jgi:hypothetical protein
VTPKRYNKIFPKIQIIRGFFGNKCTFQNWFWNLSNTSAYKLPSACIKDDSEPLALKSFDKVQIHHSRSKIVQLIKNWG